MKDLIIIGAGTSGLSAALYALRAGKSVLLLEGKYYGGQIVNTPEVENYPGIKHQSGVEFAKNLYEQVMSFGAELVYEAATSVEEAVGIKKVHTAKNTYEAKAVILATGAKNRPLGIDREQELVGRGVSYCGTCDGRFYQDKDVIVNGGGNTALEEAVFLSGYCRKVTLVHRRGGFRGDVRELEKLQKRDNVEFVMNAAITRLMGEERLTAVEVTNSETGEKTESPAAGLFVAIGQIPDNKAFKDIVRLDEKGYIIAGENCKTNTAGIFAAGDCRTKEVRQLTTATADGAVAALAACAYIN